MRTSDLGWWSEVSFPHVSMYANPNTSSPTNKQNQEQQQQGEKGIAVDCTDSNYSNYILLE